MNVHRLTLPLGRGCGGVTLGNLAVRFASRAVCLPPPLNLPRGFSIHSPSSSLVLPAAAPNLGLAVIPSEIRRADDIAPAFEEFRGPRGCIVYLW